MKNFKKVISAVVALALSASTFVSASSFTDVADTASYAEAIDVLSALGIVNGYAEEDGTYTFKPEGTITRAEAATMIVGALNMTADAQASAGTSKFADVNSQASWAAGYINVGVAQGFINGMDENTFAPQDNVTYAQMCVMLTSIAGYGEYAANNGGYPTGYTSMAATTGINKGVAVSNDTALTRGQVAQMIWNTLQTPMLGVYEYSFQGNTYTQLDGKNNRDFKTLLSDKFDGYVVTASIEATAKSSNTLNNGEATINVTKADWWDDEAVPCSVLTHTNHNETVLLNGLNLDDQLFQVGKAVLVIDDNDDVNLIYFAANSKTETKEFAAEDYVKQSKLSSGNQLSSTNPKIRFGTKYYTMKTTTGSTPALDVELYVNGVKTTNYAVNTTNLDKFLGNAQGTIKMIKEDGENGYSKIFVNYYDVAEVTSVDYKNNQTTVVMTAATNAINPVTKLVINDDAVEDGDVEISVLNGSTAIDLKDLQKDDIIAYAVDVDETTRNVTDPAFINIIVSRDTVSGKITSENTEDEQFVIDGTSYACVNYATAGLIVGNSYELTLDPFGRIYDYEEDATSTKYAIVEKWNSSAETVSLLLADGTSKAYELASNASITDATGATISLTADNGLIFDNSGAKRAPQDRVVEYTIKTSDNTIRTMKLATPVQLHTSTDKAEYKAATSKLGSATINASTNVIDATDYLDTANSNPGLSDYTAFSVDSFVDKTTYKAFAYKAAGTTTYSFVILTEVGTTFNETSRFAVIKRVVGQETYNDEDAIRVDVLAGGAEASLYYYKGNSVTSGLKTGDAIFFELDSDGFVKATYKVFDKATNTYTDFSNISAMAGKYDATSRDGWNFKLYDDGKDIQLVYAVVAEVSGNNVTLAPIPATNADIDTNRDVQSASATIGGNSYALASDAEVYVYDTGDTQSVYEYEKLYTGSVIASNFAMFETAKNSKTYSYYYDADGNGSFDAGEPKRDDYTNYALAMIVNGDIVEIYTINK